MVHAAELILDAAAGLERAGEIRHQVEPCRGHALGAALRSASVDASGALAALTCAESGERDEHADEREEREEALHARELSRREGS